MSRVQEIRDEMGRILFKLKSVCDGSKWVCVASTLRNTFICNRTVYFYWNQHIDVGHCKLIIWNTRANLHSTHTHPQTHPAGRLVGYNNTYLHARKPGHHGDNALEPDGMMGGGGDDGWRSSLMTSGAYAGAHEHERKHTHTRTPTVSVWFRPECMHVHALFCARPLRALSPSRDVTQILIWDCDPNARVCAQRRLNAVSFCALALASVCVGWSMHYRFYA